MQTVETLQLVCPSCGGLNRLPAQRLADHPVCGKCRQALLPGQPVPATDLTLPRWIAHSSLPVIVDFWADWCAPCQQFAPTFAQSAAEMVTEVCFVKLDTEANPNTAASHHIRSIPTLALFYQGRELARLAGALPKGPFQSWLRQQLRPLG